jgi:hypothetical protein
VGMGILRLLLFLVAVVGLTCGSAWADMMADSPVVFPERGALPSKYGPDVSVERVAGMEEGYYLFATPCRSLEQIAKIRAEMPAGKFTPPAADWGPLVQTRRVLTRGGELRILALGDSIVNDTMRSAWVAKLSEAYPLADVTAWVYVRGGGGCRHYMEEDRIAKYVVPKRPDLVFIGGISQGGEIDNIRTVIRQLRSHLPEVEIVLATGAFGSQADPRVAEEVAQVGYSGGGEYGKGLKRLAKEEKCAYLDMTTPWAEYIRSAGVHPHLFYRDRVHANAQGEQILSKILMVFLGQ